ncbi:glutathione synthase [Monashia sp. NPDC004114]
MTIVFVTDPLARLDPSIDTSVGLMHAAQERGADVWVTEARLLDIVDGRPRAHARQVRLAPSERTHGTRWSVPTRWFEASAPEHLWLDDTTAIFMRTEPPVDETYLHATFVLDLVDPFATALVNDPRGLRVVSEHLLPLQFPDLIPPTTVTADPDTLRAFVTQQRVAVLKPVDGFAGRGVLRLDPDDPNLPSLLELATDHARRLVIAQRYLPEVSDGNKRVFVLDGVPQAAVYRYPLETDFRIGAPASAAPVTARDRQICERLAPILARHGQRVVGLDVIGPHLIEVNVTSPGALRKADGLLGTTLCGDVVDRVLTPTRRGRKLA